MSNQLERLMTYVGELADILGQQPGEELLDCARRVRAESAKAEAQPAGTGWVSVEERLPEVGEPFNLYVPHKKLVCEGFRTSGKLWFRADGDPLPGVTHWMPLPPPPEPR